MDNKFSDYIIYVDESGHNLSSIDSNYPIFVLAFCIFKKNIYAHEITQAIQKFKFKFFGHDIILLHEHDIRKSKKDFSILLNANIREVFLNNMNDLIFNSKFHIVGVVIKKQLLKAKYTDPTNPYHLSLQFGLEQIYSFLKEKNQSFKKTHIIFESRGKKEDKDLELEFDRVCKGQNKWGNLPFELIIADKKTNSCGLQLADLVARPIGRHIIDRNQNNRSFDIIATKFYKNNGEYSESGLSCYP